MSLKHDVLELDPQGQEELFISTVTSVSRSVDTLRVTRYFSLCGSPRGYAVSCVLPVTNWDKVRQVVKEAHSIIRENKPNDPIHGLTYYC